MCFGLNILGSIFGSGSGKAQAKALREQARQERLVAQGAQQQQEAQMAQDKAADAARLLLDKPVEGTDVAVGEKAALEATNTSGRRKTPRSRFQVTPPSSGLKI